MSPYQITRPRAGLLFGAAFVVAGLADWLFGPHHAGAGPTPTTWLLSASMAAVGLLLMAFAMRQILEQRHDHDGAAKARAAGSQGTGNPVLDGAVRYEQWKARVMAPVALWFLSPVLLVLGVLLQLDGGGGWICIVIAVLGLAAAVVLHVLRRQHKIPTH